MKKILALIAVLIMGIASVSIVTSQNPCLYGSTPPSQCQECMDNFYSQAPPDADTLPYDSFFICQQRWFNPYWMEIYDGNVKGCYARDLVCYNDLPSIIAVFSEGQNDCYLYGEPSVMVYNGAVEKPLTINVPSCNDSRSFFQSPPPCERVFETDTSYSGAQILNDIGPIIIEGCCFDMRGCGNNPSLECAVPCSGYNMPANYRCDVNEYVIMSLGLSYEGGVKINGILYYTCGVFKQESLNGYTCTNTIVWYNGDRPFDPTPGVVMIQGVPRTITIEADGEFLFWLEQKCCYDCKQKPSLPSSILYPKVDIETLSIAGGPTVIKDGKILSSLTISPGVQQAMIQVENRGFFTQNDARVRFEGLPDGVTVTLSPDAQKITAHNIGTYSATFTVGPNVPSGTYKVTLIAYSPNGVFDTITIDFVVP